MSKEMLENSLEENLHQLDTSGLFCPEPVMLLHRKVREMVVGEQVKVIATDPSTWRDIPKFCTFLEHKLLNKEEYEQTFYYLIQKGETST